VVPVGILDCREPQPGIAVFDLRYPGLAAFVEAPGCLLDVGHVVVDHHSTGLCGPVRDIITAVGQHTDMSELEEAIDVRLCTERRDIPPP